MPSTDNTALVHSAELPLHDQLRDFLERLRPTYQNFLEDQLEARLSLDLWHWRDTLGLEHGAQWLGTLELDFTHSFGCDSGLHYHES